ncbi:MAG: helix-turn-helix domain-containing protein [Saprospiraceae bacterium]
MLYLNLKQIMNQRGIASPNQFLVKHGFTSYTASRILNNHLNGLSNEQLETLCVALRCTPNDLYVWQKPAGMNIPPDHPMHKLLPKKESLDMLQKLQELPLEKLDAIRQFIAEMPKE